MKKGSENRGSHDLQQHLNRIRDLTGRKERSSVISSSGRIIGPDAELGGRFSSFADKRFMTAALCIIYLAAASMNKRLLIFERRLGFLWKGQNYIIWKL
jgi:hypothetical protein